ncbi:MAG TPA: DinB family protein [Bacillales bacterium]|nr:DinB family protein [Bacillales bacterium]
MNEVQQLKKLLFDELDVAVRSTAGLLEKVKAEDWSYQQHENMRTLRELAQHLVLLPETDLAILQEKTEDEVKAIEARELADASEMIATMKEGYNALTAYFESLSDEEYLEKETRPFYMDHASTQAKWLTEIVTHAFHHRAQLFTYMKQLGYDINMFNLYV